MISIFYELDLHRFLILNSLTRKFTVTSMFFFSCLLYSLFTVNLQGGVLIVSHDEKLIDMVCKELWVVKDRCVMALEGGLEEYKRHVMTQLAL